VQVRQEADCSLLALQPFPANPFHNLEGNRGNRHTRHIQTHLFGDEDGLWLDLRLNLANSHRLRGCERQYLSELVE
jgi:hypothetical protein